MSMIRSIDLNKAVVIVDFSATESMQAVSLAPEIFSVPDSVFATTARLRELYSKYILARYNYYATKSPAVIIPPDSVYSMRGAGISYNKQTYITHTTLPFSLSAAKTFGLIQKIVIGLGLLFVISGIIISPVLALKILVSAVSILYFADVMFNLVVVMRSMQAPGEFTFDKTDLAAIDDSDLPVYSVLCPLYKEAHIFPQFLEAINKLDYPKDKLDVLLLLEEDDKETIKILDKMTLPAYIRKVIVPPSLPKTKPKACNYGLSLARGEYLVIYDAEDIPDPMQLKKAYLGFQTAPKDVQCLQAKLNYYNSRTNYLTRFFTVEYALWFDIMLTGLQSFSSSLPLGGTSNHFKTDNLKTLHGWDPFNVTEDADLGVRLFQKGFRTAVIDSTTHEEATSGVRNWIRQRSRWLKGYMQTYLVHTRNYKDFIKEKGVLHYIVFQLTVGGKILFVLINPLMWLITVLYFTSYAFAGPLLESIYTPPISYIAVFSWIFGNFLFVYYYMIACGRKKEWDLMKYVFLIPFYWAMMSAAGAVGLYQLILKPHYWEKTTHGLHLAKTVEKYKVEKKIRVSSYVGHITTFFSLAIGAINNNVNSFSNLLRMPSVEKDPKDLSHILIFNWRDTKHVYAGGAEVYIQELAKRWVQNGSRVTIFSGNDSQDPINEKLEGVDIIRCGGSYSVYVFGFLYYMFKFRGKVDLILDCENGIPFFSPLYAKEPVILLIHHVHQEIFREFLRFPMRQIAAFLEGKLMPAVYKNKKIVTVSNSSMMEIQKIGFTQPENIDIIPNGVSHFADTETAKTSNPSFMYLGRLKKYKNVDVAIKSFARILIEHQDAVLSIVGTGESHPKLKKLVSKLGIEESVRFLGKVTEDHKNQLLKESWVVVQPSQMEGWGITVIEANANRTPVIASRVNGLKDSVIDGQTGVLVDAKNIDQLAQAMKKLIEDGKYREMLSENAVAWSKNFDWDKSASDFHVLIDSNIKTSLLPKPSYAPLMSRN